jgi:hypothetical protein
MKVSGKRNISTGLESIELFIEDQTFSPSYDLAPAQPLPIPVNPAGETQED